jgi:hypothetical protein
MWEGFMLEKNYFCGVNKNNFVTKHVGKFERLCVKLFIGKHKHTRQQHDPKLKVLSNEN